MKMKSYRFRAKIRHLRTDGKTDDNAKVVETDSSEVLMHELTLRGTGFRRMDEEYTLMGQLVTTAEFNVVLSSSKEVEMLISVLQELHATFAADHKWSRKAIKKQAGATRRDDLSWLLDAIENYRIPIDRSGQMVSSFAPEGPFAFCNYNPNKESVEWSWNPSRTAMYPSIIPIQP